MGWFVFYLALTVGTLSGFLLFCIFSLGADAPLPPAGPGQDLRSLD